jgi:hypothetical protein
VVANYLMFGDLSAFETEHEIPNLGFDVPFLSIRLSKRHAPAYSWRIVKIGEHKCIG